MQGDLNQNQKVRYRYSSKINKRPGVNQDQMKGYKVTRLYPKVNDPYEVGSLESERRQGRQVIVVVKIIIISVPHSGSNNGNISQKLTKGSDQRKRKR